MPDAFLESSVVIGLLFRHAGERTACEQAIPAGATRACSRYVQYEVARGFLTSLLALHNISFEYDSYADLHLAAYSGQRRFRSYEMHTWLGHSPTSKQPLKRRTRRCPRPRSWRSSGPSFADGSAEDGQGYNAILT
jgi:hypothetical protein